jgi:hypothetical protein
MKKYLTSGLVVGLFITLMGCGNSESNTTQGQQETEVGTAYYLDSAVEGVNYQCGDQNGTTDVQGMFQFQIGEDCQFTLGDILLKTIPATQLTEGAMIVEDNVTVAAFLQTMDLDGNSSNGIDITPAITKALQENHIKSLPNSTTLPIIYNILCNTQEYHGHSVTEIEAQEHLQKTHEEIENKSQEDTALPPHSSSIHTIKPIVPFSQTSKNSIPYSETLRTVKYGADNKLKAEAAFAEGMDPDVVIVDTLESMKITQIKATIYIHEEVHYPNEEIHPKRNATFKITRDYKKGKEYIYVKDSKNGSKHCTKSYATPLPRTIKRDMPIYIDEYFSDRKLIKTTCPSWANPPYIDRAKKALWLENDTITDSFGNVSHISKYVKIEPDPLF